ncbi:competence pheromone ComX [Psychrobacillus soli]|uniref:ComX pheromone n=1 Tax=Psychrobacillus soli TaxID=1543965 RepID=A0A544TFS6_9BACI|nr:competence pheromone ComX [Psychrobacillus soli]TQR16315.1 competence pheromone ComX [Psychrobacillus soli]
MLKMIQYLNLNPEILELLKGNKVSLVGIHENEVESILDAYSKDDTKPKVYWD